MFMYAAPLWKDLVLHDAVAGSRIVLADDVLDILNVGVAPAGRGRLLCVLVVHAGNPLSRDFVQLHDKVFNCVTTWQ